jgi:hypothetical protein
MEIFPVAVMIVVALLAGATIAFGRGRNRCAVRPRIEE